MGLVAGLCLYLSHLSAVIFIVAPRKGVFELDSTLLEGLICVCLLVPCQKKESQEPLILFPNAWYILDSFKIVFLSIFSFFFFLLFY